MYNPPRGGLLWEDSEYTASKGARTKSSVVVFVEAGDRKDITLFA